ncbi:MAG: tetratricopeptide repeat protein, partial [Shewanella sp.]
LALAIGMSLAVFVGYFYWQHVRLNLAQARACLPSMSLNVPLVMGALLVLVTLAIYSQTGRYSDWGQGRTDENIDYLVAAQITKASRVVQREPQNPLALLALAQAQSAGGLYTDAVRTLDTLLQLKGEDAEVLGAKANALYYAERRHISAATQAVIDQTLALSPFEPQTQMLLATDAYLHARYPEAIDHWQLLLAQPDSSINRTAINNAIAKAQKKLTESGNSSSR